MRLLFVVQRFGVEVPGGAELFAREMATQLAARGHQVEALTSCAVSYADWSNFYPPGDEELDGVLVHRLKVAFPRRSDVFGPLHHRVLSRPDVALHLQREWMRQQGPYVPELGPWIAERSAGFDVTVFVTYLYYSTWAGLLNVRSPSILHPTAHDEPPFYLSIFDQLFAIPDAFGFLTEEEASLVNCRFDVGRPAAITGSGIDLAPELDPAGFRRRFGLGDRPYLVYAGRVDPAKGCDELYRYFAQYKRRRPGPLALVMVGDSFLDPPQRPDVVLTGFVDSATKNSAIAGAQLLVHPSRYESFSLALAEAWAAGVPALVQAHSDVLRGQCRRARGGLWYRDYLEFETALDMLLADGALRGRLGEAGRRYVNESYAWPRVMDRYEDLLDRVRGAA